MERFHEEPIGQRANDYGRRLGILAQQAEADQARGIALPRRPPSIYGCQRDESIAISGSVLDLEQYPFLGRNYIKPVAGQPLRKLQQVASLWAAFR